MVDHAHESNRSRFDSPEVVSSYEARSELTAAERTLFDAHLAPGMEILDRVPFRVTRNADFELDDEEKKG